MHKNCCLIRNNIYLCSICFDKELKESLSLLNFENLITGLTKDKYKINSRYKRKEKMGNKNDDINDFEGSKNSLINMNVNEIKRNEINNKFNKLNVINQGIFNNVDLMDIDVDIIRRNKRK
jgi:hypothetical protein